ncbi:MAG TPA: hypothetical protein VFB36_11845 [Nevskiaceae bacterium]|nr:hypothetical protein [Nevskiaceae bacterium]
MSVRAHIGAIAEALDRLEGVAPAERERTRHLMHELLEAHREGIARLIDALDPDVARRLCADDEIAALLMLHGLHPVDLRTRIADAVGKLAPRLAAQHARLEVIEVGGDGRVRLRVEHAGKRGTLHAQIEEALAHAAADAAELHIEEVISVPVQFDRLQAGARR